MMRPGDFDHAKEQHEELEALRKRVTELEAALLPNTPDEVLQDVISIIAWDAAREVHFDLAYIAPEDRSMRYTKIHDRVVNAIMRFRREAVSR